MDGVILTPLKQIPHQKGDIFHAMKKSDIGFDGFGEAYFSTINKGEIKGWKKHTKMTLNLIVPVGEIEFVLFDNRENSQTYNRFFSIKLSQNNYQRLTISKDIFVAFKGIENFNLLLNIANIEHTPNEAINLDLSEIKYEWSI
jgi:dTDP-4-dehydrorhamnose 3,5-epimerase